MDIYAVLVSTAFERKSLYQQNSMDTKTKKIYKIFACKIVVTGELFVRCASKVGTFHTKLQSGNCEILLLTFNAPRPVFYEPHRFQFYCAVPIFLKLHRP